jgi:hypothetical protein
MGLRGFIFEIKSFTQRHDLYSGYPQGASHHTPWDFSLSRWCQIHINCPFKHFDTHTHPCVASINCPIMHKFTHTFSREYKHERWAQCPFHKPFEVLEKSGWLIVPFRICWINIYHLLTWGLLDDSLNLPTYPPLS